MRMSIFPISPRERSWWWQLSETIIWILCKYHALSIRWILSSRSDFLILQPPVNLQTLEIRLRQQRNLRQDMARCQLWYNTRRKANNLTPSKSIKNAFCTHNSSRVCSALKLQRTVSLLHTWERESRREETTDECENQAKRKTRKNAVLKTLLTHLREVSERGK